MHDVDDAMIAPQFIRLILFHSRPFLLRANALSVGDVLIHSPPLATKARKRGKTLYRLGFQIP